MIFCTECGAAIPEGVKFCTTCGAPAKPQDGSGKGTDQAQPVTMSHQSVTPSVSAAAATQAPAAQTTYAAPPQVTYAAPQAVPPSLQTYPPTYAQQPAYMGEVQPPKGSRYEVMSTGAYFWTMILMSIPLIGLIACLFMAFAGKNLNRRNLAKAMLIFMIIGLILSVVLYFIFSWAYGAMVQELEGVVKESTGGANGLQDLLDMLKGLQIPTNP